VSFAAWQITDARRTPLVLPSKEKNKLQIKPNALWYLFFLFLKKKKRICIETMVVCPQRPFNFYLLLLRSTRLDAVTLIQDLDSRRLAVITSFCLASVVE